MATREYKKRFFVHNKLATIIEAETTAWTWGYHHNGNFKVLFGKPPVPKIFKTALYLVFDNLEDSKIGAERILIADINKAKEFLAKREETYARFKRTV